mmetsp:Transcript_14612/g.17782  ORF Transcript_14612/g.17782 Transcript_14612/m.17782 type:complete len:114 (-) Transcript_14612:75-416(-)
MFHFHEFDELKPNQNSKIIMMTEFIRMKLYEVYNFFPSLNHSQEKISILFDIRQHQQCYLLHYYTVMTSIFNVLVGSLQKSLYNNKITNIFHIMMLSKEKSEKIIIGKSTLNM